MSGHVDAASATDRRWAEVARGARRALADLGYDRMAHCMPDEATPCGASAQLHALAYLATINAVCDHQLAHLGADPATVSEIYRGTAHDLDASPECQGVHQ